MSPRTAEVLHAVRTAVPTWRTTLRSKTKVDSPFAGMHKTAKYGPGEDWSDARLYQPGDDVRRIDWAATARSGETQVRSTLADRGMRITLVVDCSPSMQFGTNTLTKADLALATAAAVALTATRQTDSVAAMLVRPGDLRWVSPGSGVAHTNVLLKYLLQSFSTEGSASIAEGMTKAYGHATAPGLFVIISDFLDDDAASALRKISSRHRTLAVVTEDLFEREVYPAGLVEVYDPETEEYMLLDTDSPKFRARFTEIAEYRRTRRDEMLRSSGADVHIIECGPNWLSAVGSVVSRRAA